jgi:hypothetical protein
LNIFYDNYICWHFNLTVEKTINLVLIMKQNSLLISLWVLLFLFTQCSTEEDPQTGQTEQVQFAVAIPQTENDGGRTAADLPEGSKLLISISNSDGAVLSSHSVTILKFGDEYITEPLDLPIGRYSVTDFLVTSAPGNVLFATPKHGSMLAGAVNRPLPFSFVVGKGKITTYPMEVVNVATHSPEAFGYASFNIDVVNPIGISVFIEENGKLVLTEATGYLYADDDGEFIQEFPLGAKINYIPFAGEPDQPYTIHIDKAGYESVYKEFVYDELGASAALSFVLEKSPDVTLNIDAKAYESSEPLILVLRARLKEAGSITVDWGDGSVETTNFGGGNELELQLYHAYDEEMRTASVTLGGDLDKVVMFVGTNCRYHNLEVLPNLEEFRDFRSDLDPIDVDELDLSQNFKLKYVSLDEGGYDLKLGDEKTDLKQFWFRGQYNHAQIIPELERHITSNNIHDGIIEFFHGPTPSDENLDILRNLSDSYGWYIAFDYEAL